MQCTWYVAILIADSIQPQAWGLIYQSNKARTEYRNTSMFYIVHLHPMRNFPRTLIYFCTAASAHICEQVVIFCFLYESILGIEAKHTSYYNIIQFQHMRPWLRNVNVNAKRQDRNVQYFERLYINSMVVPMRYDATL